MKAVAFHRFGGPEVLELGEQPDPVPGRGEALVRVRACGVNHLDLDLRAGVSGFPVPLPHILGIEVAGEVVARGPAGEGPPGPGVGERVLVVRAVTCGACESCVRGQDNLCATRQTFGVNRPGGYAEYVVAPVSGLLPLALGLGFEEAAAVQVAFSTAWHMLIERARLRAGETVLVTAAGSGVGSAAVQIALRAGARVIATAGSGAKRERLRELGVHGVVDHGPAGWPDEVRRLTGGVGVDLVFEHVGGRLWAGALALLRRGGRLVTCGAHGGQDVSLDVIDLFRREIALLGAYSAPTGAVREVVRLVADGTYRPVVHASLPLCDASRAHGLLAAREAFGKVVLVPA
jgi:NADPH:quinone reductase-like Zn-dependent oxidoreductase